MKKFILKSLLVLSFVPFAIVSVMIFSMIEQYQATSKNILSVNAYVNRIYNTGRWQSPSYRAEVKFDDRKFSVCLNCDGANYKDYINKDSLEIWIQPSSEIAFLREEYPTVWDFRKSRLEAIVFIGLPFVLLFFVLLFLYIKEVRKKKIHENK